MQAAVPAQAAAPAPDEVPAQTERPAQADADETSYVELARRSLLARLDVAVEAVRTLGASMQPHHERVKAVRKQILNLRTGLDVFPYAYGNSASGDPLRALRKMLDRGYELIGHFKDEFDAQGRAIASMDPSTGRWSDGVRPDDQVVYRHSDRVAKERSAVLQWKAEFLASVPDQRDYLGSPLRTPAVPQQKRKLSEHYWGGVPAHPKAEHGGHQTVARLMRGMLDDVFAKFKRLRQTSKLEKQSHQELFHNARKQLRAALSLADEFPNTLIDPGTHAEMRERLIDLVTDMGAIEDQVVAMLDAPKHERGAAQREIQQAWKALRRDLDRQDIGDLLRDFRRNLLK
ncbi:MAG: hypothetical protein IPK13_06230 [Deltaproteobacteria bacterium]|nr:hypothetical protein [Deltaproteobacteria bacterium]